jgi:hypothetical protein
MPERVPPLRVGAASAPEPAAETERRRSVRALRATALLRPWLWSVLTALAVTPPWLAGPVTHAPFGAPWFLGWLLVLSALFSLALALGRSAPESRAEPARRRCWAVLVFLLAYTGFVANYRTISAADNLPTRALPHAILSGQGFDLSSVLPERLHRHWSVTRADGALRSAYPVGTGLLVTPYYALARALDPRAAEVEASTAWHFEKHASALLCAFAIAWLFLGATDLAPTEGRRAFLALTLASSTPLLSAVSQGLWSQTGELFLSSLAVFALARRGSGPGGELASGLAMGAAFLCRPTALLLVPAVLCLALATACAVALNLHLSGHPLGAYARLNRAAKFWGLAGFEDRLAGVLFSPSRGLVWFFPALVLAAAFATLSWRRLSPRQRTTALASAATVGAVCLVTANNPRWWGGHSSGPRLLAELALPALLSSALVLRVGGRGTRAALIALLILQSVVHFRIYSVERAVTWNRTVQVDQNIEALWSVRDGLLAAAFLPDPEGRRRDGPYFPVATARSGNRRWTSLDLASVANADYGAPRPRREPFAAWHLHLPRLALEHAAGTRESGFSFLPPGRPNMIQLCSSEVVEHALPAERKLERIALVLSWRGTETPAGPVGRLTLVRDGGRDERRLLLLGREVFDPVSSLAAPTAAIVAGSRDDSDELARSVLVVRKGGAVRALRWQGPDRRDAGCLHVLAVSVQ